MSSLNEINSLVERESSFVKKVLAETSKVIVGQQYVIERLLMGVLTGGHILLEGVPGLAKTLSINTLSKAVSVDFKRIQFTPDLLPADLIGTMMYNQAKQEFYPKFGPVFTNFVLADEINRAPAKVQSALLEAMQEKQVTLGDKTYKLKEPFLVLATQNPIDQEGTYSLPEAQVDRFIMKIKVDYLSKPEERLMIERMSAAVAPTSEPCVDAGDLLRARQVVSQIYLDDKVKDYVLDIVFCTRNPKDYNLESLENLITHGASPRASLALINVAKAHAFINGRGYVTPEDIKAVGKDVLRHRIIPSFEAEAEEVSSEDIVDKIFSEVEVP
ncbi:ATPase [Candidatus Marinamargulisbacteria bacterium SCGC AAA071-K20]|nr:ATPase [Candidatus Marinamargulisbacteria bacterium SCGC AAA071-K20]